MPLASHKCALGIYWHFLGFKFSKKNLSSLAKKVLTLKKSNEKTILEIISTLVFFNVHIFFKDLGKIKMPRQYNKKTLEQRANDLERQAAALREKERKQRTSYLVDLGGAFLALMGQLLPERREKWLTAAMIGLTGKALARRQASVTWMRDQLTAQSKSGEGEKSNFPPCGGNATSGSV